MTTSKPLTDRQQAFLDAYRYSGMVKEAAAQAGCSRELHYNALRTSETYREAFAVVQQVLAFELEEEARRRAVDGVKIPVLYRGKVIGYDTRYSDALLIFLLEANHPEKFRAPPGTSDWIGDRDCGFSVRSIRDEVGRPTLPRMTGPKPPMPPQPPRPPRPPGGFWLHADGCDESVETPTDTATRTPPDPAVIARWATNPIFDVLPSVWDAALMEDLSSDHPFAQRPEDAPSEIDDPGSEDRDDCFCVRSPDGTEDSPLPSWIEWSEPPHPNSSRRDPKAKNANRHSATASPGRATPSIFHKARLGVAAPSAQPIALRRPGPAGRWSELQEL